MDAFMSLTVASKGANWLTFACLAGAAVTHPTASRLQQDFRSNQLRTCPSPNVPPLGVVDAACENAACDVVAGARVPLLADQRSRLI
jgi:hypothetical protein